MGRHVHPAQRRLRSPTRPEAIHQLRPPRPQPSVRRRVERRQRDLGSGRAASTPMRPACCERWSAMLQGARPDPSGRPGPCRAGVGEDPAGRCPGRGRLELPAPLRDLARGSAQPADHLQRIRLRLQHPGLLRDFPHAGQEGRLPASPCDQFLRPQLRHSGRTWPTWSSR